MAMIDGYEQGLSAGGRVGTRCLLWNHKSPPTLFLLLGYTIPFGLQPCFLLEKQKTL